MLRAVFGFTLAAVAMALTTTTASANDRQPQAEILHWWSSEGEFAALAVFIDEFKARGGYYYDSSNHDEVANREAAIERMGKGYPATLMQWNAGNDLIDLYQYGLLKPVRSRDLVERLKRTLPPLVLDTVSYDGEIIAVPLNIHSENWMWYSQDHLGQSDFKLSGDWKALLETGEILAEKGIPLLAVGDQQWQIRILFTSVFLGVSRERYRDFYISNDINVADTKEFRTTLEVFNKLARFSKSFGDGNWDTQIRAVADNLAAANFMGDWARGEFKTHGHQAGKDYGCQLTPATDPALLVVIDTLVLGKINEDSEVAGQNLMLDVVTDPAISAQFNALKGSVSPYAHADDIDLDVCTRQVHTALSHESAIIPPYQSYFAEHGRYGEIIDVAILDFWKASLQSEANSEELVEQTLETFRSILQELANDPTQSATVED